MAINITTSLLFSGKDPFISWTSSFSLAFHDWWWQVAFSLGLVFHRNKIACFLSLRRSHHTWLIKNNTAVNPGWAPAAPLTTHRPHP